MNRVLPVFPDINAGPFANVWTCLILGLHYRCNKLFVVGMVNRWQNVRAAETVPRWPRYSATLQPCSCSGDFLRLT